MAQGHLTHTIIEHGRNLGCCAVGVATVTPMDPASFRAWLDAGYGAEMAFLERHLPLRADLTSVLPGARSVICAALAYPANAPGPIAAYARGRDYHDVMRERLTALWTQIHPLLPPEAKARIFVDSGPLPERELARRAGLGWLGGQGCLIVPGVGTRVVLGEILTTAHLEPTSARAGACGACTACRQACPTGAIVAPGIVDARRCLSYLTIEHRGPIPRHLRPALGTRLFGCDACQDACPHNAAPTCSLDAFRPLPQWATMDPITLLAMTTADIKHLCRGTALQRVKRSGWLRNACVALGNGGDPAAVPALRRALHDEESVIRGHAAWALGQLGDDEGLRDAFETERDADVREEMASAIKKSAPE